MLVVFSDSAYLLIDSRYFEKASKVVTDASVMLLTDTYKQIAELMLENNTAKVYIETDVISIGQYKRMYDGFVKHNVPAPCDSDKLTKAIRDARSIKSQDEIDCMIKAQRIAEKALEKTLKQVFEGITEKELQLALDFNMLSSGAEALSFDTIVLFGENTSMPHGVPGDRALKEGDPILIDFGAVYDGYHSDMTRTFIYGKSNEKFEEVYNIVLKAQALAIDSVKAGIKGNKLDKIARDYIDENGYGDYFGHGLGHSVGLEIHEYPNANKSCDAILVENTIMTVEPGIYLPGEFGVRIEDFVVVKDDGCLNMTDMSKVLTII